MRFSFSIDEARGGVPLRTENGDTAQRTSNTSTIAMPVALRKPVTCTE